MCSINCSRNYLCVIIVVLSFINISSISLSANASVTQSETCLFTLNSGLIIDLSPLVNPDQSMYTSTNTSLYIYHPCTDVQLKTAKPTLCKSYQLCYFEPKVPTNKPVDFHSVLENSVQGDFHLLGLQDEGVFRENQKNQPEIVYKHKNSESSAIITTYMQLVCDHKIENYTLAIEKTSPNHHELTLSSKHICVNAESHMSGAAVFFIILLVFAALYFIGGILVLKFIRGATGVEMIPNHEFWCKLPQMAKDGITYLSSCGKVTPDSYEQI